MAMMLQDHVRKCSGDHAIRLGRETYPSEEDVSVFIQQVDHVDIVDVRCRYPTLQF